MSIKDVHKIDGVGISKEEDALVLMVSDHVKWRNIEKHLDLWKNKLNSYILFIEEKQYEEMYKDITFQKFIIEIYCKYEIPEQGKIFLEAVREQIKDLNILVRTVV